MASKSERTERIRQADHQLAMEGLEPTERSMRNARDFISGQFTIEKLRERTLREIRSSRHEEVAAN